MASTAQRPRSTPPAGRLRAAARATLAVLFVGAGVLHFAIPRSYASIVPPALPAPLLLVYVSGACEVAGGLGLLVAGTRRWAAIGLVALLAAVFPANVQMLLNAMAAGRPQWQLALLWLRLPLQPLLMWLVWRSAARHG